MSAIRILHVDDEPDIREVVNMSLSLSSDFDVQACACGTDAISTAAAWSPSLILLDVMMPDMDGPTTLKELRKNPQTAEIPVLFMTARAQSSEVAHFISLGAEGVISKPFDPMTLATQVRGFYQNTRMETLRSMFLRRAKSDAGLLAPLQSSLEKESSTAELTRIKEIAHGLAGAAGMYGFDKVSRDALALEDAIFEKLDHGGTREAVSQALEGLLSELARISDPPTAYVA
jgi:CheY-like chemotaxis protein